MSQAAGVPEVLFSIKAFIAAMAAMWLAMRLGLDRPYWAVITSYITAQPLAGAVKSKSVFRALGTLAGVTAAVIFVPTFVNAPELLTLVLALWLATCAYLSLLDRSPKAYAFALAGYTAAIIGFPSVGVPASIFTVATLRGQEILLGIVCSAVVHSLVFPTSTLAHVRGRARSIVDDTRHWLIAALDLSQTGSDSDRRRLATDLHELHQLAVHLSFDSGSASNGTKVIRALQQQLARLLPFVGGVEDRLRQFAGDVPIDIERIRSEVVASLEAPATGDVVDWDDLTDRIRSITPPITTPLNWRNALQANFLARLQVMVDAYRKSLELVTFLETDAPPPRSDAADESRITLHRDHGVAVRGALGTFFAIVTTAAIWIATTWPDGATAVIFAGIWMMLFSSMDNARPVLLQILLGTVAGMLMAVVYVGVVLPRVTDFVTLAAVLAPALLLVGTMMPRARTAMFAVGIVNSFPAFLGLGQSFGGSVPIVLNTAIAQITGTAISILFLTLFRLPRLKESIPSLVRMGRRELARRATARRVAPIGVWSYAMMDRIAILSPRAAFLGIDPKDAVTSILRDVRTGISISELREVQSTLSTSGRKDVDTLLRRIAAYLTSPVPENQKKLLITIDRVLRRAAAIPDDAARHTAIVALVGMRRNLLPSADAPSAPETRDIARSDGV